MALTTASDMLTPQILEDAIRGAFKKKTAFMGSALAASGAVIISGTMPRRGREAIGKTIDVPYFGTIPGFANNPDGSSVTPSKLAQTSEQATIARSSLAVETSRWAQGVGAVDPALGDPHDEAGRQAVEQAEREMDAKIVTAFAATPLIRDIYSATSPLYLTHQQVVRARSLYADDQDGIVAMVTHSQAESDLSEMLDANGRPLLTETVREGAQGQVVDKRFAGMALLISDSVPLTGSAMGSNTATGTSAPVATLTGTPTGPWDLVIECQVGGAHATATLRFSTDGGNTWSADITTLGVGVALALTDTAVDSLVGNNGATGVSVAFAAGTFNADNKWVARANLKVTSLICQRMSGAFWYNQDALAPQPDHDTFKDSDTLALHLYHVAHLYRRRRGGARPGVIALKHNVRQFIG
jgi:hypothetical protein